MTQFLGYASIICLSFLLTAAWAQPKTGRLERVELGGLRNVVELRFALEARYGNPYDPDEIAVDAVVTGPMKQKWLVPAFWFEPFSRTVQTARLELGEIRLLRFFICTDHFGMNQTIRFEIDDIEVFNSKTGAKKVIDDFKGEVRWQAQHGVTIEKAKEDGHGGRTSLLVQIVTGEESRWPGLNLVLGADDWSAFDSLRLQFRPISGLGRGSVMCEFYNTKNEKFQGRIYEPPAILMEPKWREVVWRFQTPMPKSVWTPEGKGSWRVRIAVPEDGEYSIRLRAKDSSGESEGEAATFQLKRLEQKGILCVDEKTKRYLRFDSGEPYLASGTNLISDDVATYEYYLPKFAAAGCNFLRFWMSGRSLGIEREELTKYDGERAAAVDQLVNCSRDHGIYLMFCLTDFREAGEGKHHYWDKVAYSKICKSPLDFFSSDTAIRAYKKRLRYVVARWSASAAVHSWEFFNEVNITNSWREEPTSVRAWHRVMAEYLHDIDPYGHVITSSFAGIEDDELWEQPLMQIAQRHFYTSDFVSFADALSEATRLLEHHEKPSIVGEFGRAKNLHANADSEGVSLHNGIWAPPLSGSSGTGMPWWWQWIDGYDLYRHYAMFSEFIRNICWHDEEFTPIPTENIETKIAEDPSTAPLQTVRLTPVKGSFQAAPFNAPVRVTVKSDGTTDPPGLICNIQHGIRHHRDLHNPQTFKVNFPVAGKFNVYVSGVSGYGGAGLRISLDGEVKMDKEFTDKSREETLTITEYNGCYSMDVPAGEHTITIENMGTDWFNMPLITLTNYGSFAASVKVLGIRGKSTCLLWVRNTAYVWYAPLLDLKAVPARDVLLRLSGCVSGTYDVELFSPQTGKWLSKRECSSNGTVEIPLGTVVKDIAVRMTKK